MISRHLLLAVSASVVLSTQPFSSAHAQNEYGQFEWLEHKTLDGAHPSPMEQKMLFLLNQARNNPHAEGVRLQDLANTDAVINNEYNGHQVQLGKMKKELKAIANMGPVAFDRKLYRGQRDHNQWMIANNVQSHGDEVTTCPIRGGSFSSIGGHDQTCRSALYFGTMMPQYTGINFYTQGKSAEHLHAGLIVDWGATLDGNQSLYGMQDPRGHRINRLRPDARVIGLAIEAEKVKATENVGKYVMSEIVTRDDGNPNEAYLVGTVWQDRNANGEYDEGEGISGVEVEPVSTGSWYAVTGQAGGYALPMSGQPGGTIAVKFSGGDLQTPLNMQIPVTGFAGSENVLANLLVPGDDLLIHGDASEDLFLARDVKDTTLFGNNYPGVVSSNLQNVVRVQFENLGEDYVLKIKGVDISATDVAVTYNSQPLGFMYGTVPGGSKFTKFSITREMQNPGWDNTLEIEYVGTDATWAVGDMKLKSQRVASNVLTVSDPNNPLHDSGQPGGIAVKADSGKFGWKYGTSQNYTVVRYVTEVATPQNVTLKAWGYDVGVNTDLSTHVAIYVNGTHVDDMDSTATGVAVKTEISGVALSQGTNIIEFRHVGPYKNHWGISGVKLVRE